MKKNLGWIVTGVVLMILFMGLTCLVEGRTLKMAQANIIFNSGEYQDAQELYEDLTVDLPRSPYVLHNLGLAALQQGKYDKAVTEFRKAIDRLATEKCSPARRKQLNAVFYYHLGNALFKSAGNARQEAALKLYFEALENYKKALQANPRDEQAKFNYELTVCRLQSQSQSEQQQIQDILQSAAQSEQYQNPPETDEPPVGKDW